MGGRPRCLAPPSSMTETCKEIGRRIAERGDRMGAGEGREWVMVVAVVIVAPAMPA